MGGVSPVKSSDASPLRRPVVHEGMINIASAGSVVYWRSIKASLFVWLNCLFESGSGKMDNLPSIGQSLGELCCARRLQDMSHP